MPVLKVMTFNVENMLARFRFREFEEDRLSTLLEYESEAERAELIRTHWNVVNNENRTFTALTIAEPEPDVVCLQEVENMRALKAFSRRYLKWKTGQEFPYQMLIEGNDPRGIDVAVLSRYRIVDAVTHQHLTPTDIGMPDMQNADGSPRQLVFSRDCLEVHVKKHNKILPIFVCHFKSMSGGRDQTRPIRLAEATAVRQIISQRMSDAAADKWVIAGDLNDYTESDGTPDHEHGLGPLFEGDFSVDMVKRRIADPLGRWTHFYSGERSYHQLDYLLMSPTLADENQDAELRIVRNGQPFRAARYEGQRWPRVGYDNPKASDHCAIVADISY